MNLQTLINAMFFCVGKELQHRPKPVQVPYKTQENRAALAMQHVSGLLDSVTDPELRQAVTLAFCALEYTKTALNMKAGPDGHSRKVA